MCYRTVADKVFFVTMGGKGRSHFHDYCNGFAGAFSAGLAQCHLVKLKKYFFFIKINLI